MKITPQIQVASVVVLLGAGFLLGRSLKGPSRTHESAPRVDVAESLTQKHADESHHRAPTIADPGATNIPDDGNSSREKLINRFVECFSINSPEERRVEFLNLLHEMRAADAPAVLDLLKREQKQGVFSEPEWHAFWARWGSLDGATALEYHLSLPDSQWNGVDIWQTMRGWSEANPDQAAAWLSSHPDMRHQDNAFLGYVDGLASKDLKAATTIALASIHNGDPLMSEATEQLADQAVRQGKLAGLEAWFDQLPADTDPGSAKRAAEEHVWWRMKTGDFDTAVEWVRKHAGDPWRSDQIIGEVAGRLSRDDPQTALAWLQDVRASPIDGSYPGLNKVMENWAKKDAASIEAWLNQPNGGALQQQATAQYAAYLARTDPEAAKIWSQRVASSATPNQ